MIVSIVRNDRHIRVVIAYVGAFLKQQLDDV